MMGTSYPANYTGLRDPLQLLWTSYNIVLCNAVMDHVIVKQDFLVKLSNDKCSSFIVCILSCCFLQAFVFL